MYLYTATTYGRKLVHKGIGSGYKVLVIDVDLQGTAVQWSSISEQGFPAVVVALSESKNLHLRIAQFGKDYHFILVDSPPSKENISAVSGTTTSALVHRSNYSFGSRSVGNSGNQGSDKT